MIFFAFFSIKECARTTFDDIVQELIPDDYEGHPALDKNASPFEFYYSLLKQIISAIVEDKTVYQPYIKKYRKEEKEREGEECEILFLLLLLV